LFTPEILGLIPHLDPSKQKMQQCFYLQENSIFELFLHQWTLKNFFFQFDLDLEKYFP